MKKEENENNGSNDDDYDEDYNEESDDESELSVSESKNDGSDGDDDNDGNDADENDEGEANNYQIEARNENNEDDQAENQNNDAIFEYLEVVSEPNENAEAEIDQNAAEAVVQLQHVEIEDIDVNGITQQVMMDVARSVAQKDDDSKTEEIHITSPVILTTNPSIDTKVIKESSLEITKVIYVVDLDDEEEVDTEVTQAKITQVVKRSRRLDQSVNDSDKLDQARMEKADQSVDDFNKLEPSKKVKFDVEPSSQAIIEVDETIDALNFKEEWYDNV
ncbi:hypothetical protein QVD17_19640 [Tagetes erecta]|uniref:Uncharacterized protein n=1 Tax=Tagetes erecta TaxID=13708 RepID=A0AAD8KMN5_TARER|nr:hypothetical protein QVD17_19640 [Tagetes erecta]